MGCTSIYNLATVTSEICDGNVGGLATVYIALRSSVKITKPADTDDKDSSIATVELVEGAGKFYEYGFRKNTSTFTSTLNADADNATQYWTTEAVLQFKKTEAAKRSAIMALCQNDIVVVAKDNNGVYWLLGADGAVTATGGNHTIGTARSDSNHYEITLSDESNEAPYTVEWNDEILAGLVAS